MNAIPTTMTRRFRGQRSGDGLGVIGLLVVVGLSACGPSIDAPPEVQQWMLGVFSNRQPEGSSDYGYVTQYHVYDDFEVDKIDFNSGGQSSIRRRRWEPRGVDSFAMFPAEEERTIISEWLVHPREGASLDCGPYDVVTIYGPTSSQPGPQPNPETIHRGAVCVYAYDCTPTPDDPDACFGFAYTLDWCDEPPPPCEDPDG